MPCHERCYAMQCMCSAVHGNPMPRLLSCLTNAMHAMRQLSITTHKQTTAHMHRVVMTVQRMNWMKPTSPALTARRW